MKVQEIKEALRSRNAPVSGNKAVLVDRLKVLVGSEFIWVEQTQEDIERENESRNERNVNTRNECGPVWVIQEVTI